MRRSVPASKVPEGIALHPSEYIQVLMIWFALHPSEYIQALKIWFLPISGYVIITSSTDNSYLKYSVAYNIYKWSQIETIQEVIKSPNTKEKNHREKKNAYGAHLQA